MKESLSKKNYCYKIINEIINTINKKQCLTPFYRQPLFFKKNLEPPPLRFFKNLNPPCKYGDFKFNKVFRGKGVHDKN